MLLAVAIGGCVTTVVVLQQWLCYNSGCVTTVVVKVPRNAPCQTSLFNFLPATVNKYIPLCTQKFCVDQTFGKSS